VLTQALLGTEDPLFVLACAEQLELALTERSAWLADDASKTPTALLLSTDRLPVLLPELKGSGTHLSADLEASVLAHVLATSPVVPSPDAASLALLVPAELSGFLTRSLERAALHHAPPVVPASGDLIRTAETALALLASAPTWEAAWRSSEALES
jgi:hypothetical protein